ncbi:hypothetical protein DIZ81_11720 [Legionella taurinensis]|uniref:Uncharacterized protein n=1 Tax=Legionella taurinensis TaxID=70611 RepID=A0A3A5L2H7_9GAMM|nr:hypothetical protein [Legionella taurinensis]MDX1838628.1 hypothetical protein [Legionella taurinensis]PUT39064.1 hypothetical protein DB744_11730 [Legionella taurinensis]PUT41150.1 hypothetical protein DB746_10120 [Legionella taurinensis]PUT43525.1 hypothetical protein DB743_11125 [Legionella taurinensis]PUT46542.1 hypothetical protein DB745_10610 [Legionella taurinensis]
MAILKGNLAGKKEKVKIELKLDTLRAIECYCEWAKIDDIGYFVEEAAQFVFSKDREWKQHLKQLKKTGSSSQN